MKNGKLIENIVRCLEDRSFSSGDYDCVLEIPVSQQCVPDMHEWYEKQRKNKVIFDMNTVKRHIPIIGFTYQCEPGTSNCAKLATDAFIDRAILDEDKHLIYNDIPYTSDMITPQLLFEILLKHKKAFVSDISLISSDDFYM